MSHTVTTKIELKNAAALDAAVQKLGGRFLGAGSHQLYAGAETGLGFTLPGWRYPLVSRANGTLAYDDYHSRWGDPADLERLKATYAIEAARAEATAQCWMTQDQPDGSLLIYHPEGGTLTVTAAGTIDAAGFTGDTCSRATEPIARALGQATSETRKEEYGQIQQQVNEAD